MVYDALRSNGSGEVLVTLDEKDTAGIPVQFAFPSQTSRFIGSLHGQAAGSELFVGGKVEVHRSLSPAQNPADPSGYVPACER